MILPESGLKIPIRTQLAEVFGTYLSKKHKISVILFAKENRDYLWNGFKIYEIKYTKKIWVHRYFLSFIKKLKKVQKDEKIDIVFGRNCYVIGNLFYPIAKILKTPLILQLTFPIREILHAPYILSKVLLFDLIYTMKISDLILPISPLMGKYLSRVWNVSQNTIFDFPDGVNLSKFSSNSINVNKNFSLVYLGVLAKRRKLSFLIDVMSLVVEKLPNANLAIVGDGDDRKNLENLTKKVGLSKNIKFIGKVPYEEVPKYLMQSEIGVVPLPPTLYYKLSSPLKLFEYMGSGLPVIATEEVLEHKKALTESKGGIVVPYDKNKFANAIIELLKQKNKFVEMGRNNINWVKKNRDYSIIADKVEEVFENTLKEFRSKIK